MGKEGFKYNARSRVRAPGQRMGACLSGRTRAFFAICSSGTVDRRRLIGPQPHSRHSSQHPAPSLVSAGQSSILRAAQLHIRDIFPWPALRASSELVRPSTYIATGTADLPERLSMPRLIAARLCSAMLVCLGMPNAVWRECDVCATAKASDRMLLSGVPIPGCRSPLPLGPTSAFQEIGLGLLPTSASGRATGSRPQ